MKQIITAMQDQKEMMKAVYLEIVYQEHLWSESEREKKDLHTLPEWLNFISVYLEEAKTLISKKDESVADDFAADALRKVAAMILSAADQGGFEDLLVEEGKRDLTVVPNSVGELIALTQYPVAKMYESYSCGAFASGDVFKIYFSRLFCLIVKSLTSLDKVVFRGDLNKNEGDV